MRGGWRFVRPALNLAGCGTIRIRNGWAAPFGSKSVPDAAHGDRITLRDEYASMLETWLSDPSKVGATAVLLFCIWALLKGTVVTAAHHEQVVADKQAQIDALTKEKKEFKDLLFVFTDTNRRLSVVAEKSVAAAKVE